MRQALAKGKRRELRRAMGEGALGHITAQDQAVAILQNAVASCQREIAALAVNHAAFKADQAAAHACLDHDSDIHDELLESFGEATATFLGRLRWLFTGK